MSRSKLTIIAPYSRIDCSNAKQFYREAIAAIGSDKTSDKNIILVIDMADIGSIDSCGLGALIKLLKAVRMRGNEIALCSPTESVRVLFSLTAINKLFKIFASRQDFFRSFEESPEMSMVA